MDNLSHFQHLELLQFVLQQCIQTSEFSAKRFQDTEEKVQTFLTHDHKLEYLPAILIYLKRYYDCCTCPSDTTYLDERIAYYELLLKYTKTQPPPVPKNVLRRRNLKN